MSTSITKRLGGVAGVAVLGLAAACGAGGVNDDGGDSAAAAFSDQSVAEIEKDVEKAMKALSSLRMKGTVTTDGQKTAMDLAFDTEGTCTGSIGVGGGTAEILHVDGSSYIRGDEAFWKENAGDSAEMVTALLGDKWAKVSSEDGGEEDINEFCDLDALLEEMDGDSDGEVVTKGEVVTIDGQKALEMTSKGTDGTTSIWVAVEGKPYILKFEQVDGDEPGSIAFSDFDEPVDAKAPAKDEFVDFAAMGG